MKAMAAMLILFVLTQPFSGAAPKRSIKEQVLLIPINSTIEVKLLQTRSRITGQLISVSDNGFEILADKITSEEIPFSDVESVKVKEKDRGMNRKSKILIGAIIAGILTVVGAALAGD